MVFGLDGMKPDRKKRKDITKMENRMVFGLNGMKREQKYLNNISKME